MGELKHDGLAVPARVVLAYESSFTLGKLRVNPATREVAGGARSDILEPRVMQVLVVLARAEGAIVTRDELIVRCWDGRIVGEDAINRALSRIRHVAGEIGEGSFRVETITKVGYRLVGDGLPRERSVAHAMDVAIRAQPRVRHFNAAIASALAAVAVLLAVGVWQFLPGTPTVPTIAILPAVASDEGSRALAQSIAL